MNIARRIGLFLATISFGFFLFGFVTTTSLAQSLGQPGKIKDWLKKSDIYNRAIPAVLEQVDKNKDKSDTSDQVSLDDPAIQSIAQKVFTPAFLEDSSDKIIDGTYRWLDGKTAKPDFQIDVGSLKTQFANEVGAYARGRYLALPLCTTRPTEVDLLKTSCRVPVSDAVLSQQIQNLTDDIKNNKDFLPDATITANSIKTGEDGNRQPLFEKQNQASNAYRFLKISPFIFGALAILDGLGIVLLNQDRRRGIKHVLTTLLTTSGLLLFYVWLMDFALNKAQDSVLKQTASGSGPKIEALKQSVITIIRSAHSDLSRVVVYCVVGFLCIAVALAIYLFVTRTPKPKNPEHVHFKKPSSPSPEKSPENSKASSDTPKAA